MILSLLDQYLYTSTSYVEFTTKFLNALRASSLKCRICAGKIEEYLHIEDSKSFLAEAEKMRTQAAKQLETISPASFTISGRKKSFRSNAKKIELAYPELDDVKDEFAFRIIISDNKIGKKSATIFCYMVAKTLIDFFIDKNFIPIDIKAKSDGFPNKDIIDKIYLPTIEDITIYSDGYLDGYLTFIKDYILAPKSNGYQGLHILVKDATTRRYFEFQIRTSSMHEWAEIGDASHSLNYKPLDDITFDSIKIDGFEYSQSEGIIRDEHGIIKPLAIGEIYQYQILGDEITWLNIT